MTEQTGWRLGIDRIHRYLPHRHPFLLLDRVLEIHPVGPLKELTLAPKGGTRVVAEKNFTFNEPFFAGHFPGNPIVPGVLLIETMAQASAFTLYPNIEALGLLDLPNPIRCILVGVDESRFRSPVVPGDCFRVETFLEKGRDRLSVFRCKGFVGDTLAAEATILANVSAGEES